MVGHGVEVKPCCTIELKDKAFVKGKSDILLGILKVMWS